MAAERKATGRFCTARETAMNPLAPGAPHVFIDDAEFKNIWGSNARVYLLIMPENVVYARHLLDDSALKLIGNSGGKLLYSNVSP